MNLAEFDKSMNTIALTQQGFNWRAMNARHDGSFETRSREQFSKMLAVVRQSLELRQPSVRWQKLRAELLAIGEGEPLKLDELRVLDDICAHFADDGEAVALDDALRRMQDLDVRYIATGLEQNKHTSYASGYAGSAVAAIAAPAP